MIALDVLITQASQAEAIVSAGADIGRVYVSLQAAQGRGEGLHIPQALKGLAADFFIALPFVTRQEEGAPCMDDLEDVRLHARDAGYKGVLVRNMEQLGFFTECDFEGDIITDANVYAWNHRAIEMLTKGLPGGRCADGITAPYELSLRQFADAYRQASVRCEASVIVYGHPPMMVSAGCLKQTLDQCTGKRHLHEQGTFFVTDRTNRTLPVTYDCRYCYNILWNAHPLSLADDLKRIATTDPSFRARLDLTVEEASFCAQVIAFFDDVRRGRDTAKAPYRDYTRGRSKKGVE